MNYLTTPIITGVLAQELHEKSAQGKPTARGTMLRYSSAFSCARQQGYAALGADQTEPMDEAGAWVTGLGTIVHEAAQDAISRRFPSAQFELSSQNQEVSGSCDALISVDDLGSAYGGTHALWELKTMGTFSFDMQVGWNRMRGTFKDGGPQGPAVKAIAQAGMNALGIMRENPEIDIQTIVMGSLSFEALSKQKASNMGVEGLNRFVAEFEIPRSEWEPIAQVEINRMQSIYNLLYEAQLPERIALDDNGDVIRLNPETGRAWQCEYCPFKSTCLKDGDGIIDFDFSAGWKHHNG